MVPAIIWALANEWSDPEAPLLSALAREEILNGGAPADRHAPPTFIDEVMADES